MLEIGFSWDRTVFFKMDQFRSVKEIKLEGLSMYRGNAQVYYLQ